MGYPPSSSSIHEITNTQITVSPGCPEPTSTQKQQIGVVLDLFQAKGTMAKLKDWLSDDAVYEDLFATCEGRDEVGEFTTDGVNDFARRAVRLTSRVTFIWILLAGQFLGLPVVCKSSETISHTLTSIHSPPTETSSKATHAIPTPNTPGYEGLYQMSVDIKHRFEFKPLGNKVEMNSTLLIFALPGKEGEGGAKGKIVRIQDRPVDDIPENSLITVSSRCCWYFLLLLHPSLPVVRHHEQ